METQIINYLAEKGLWKNSVKYEPITLGAGGAKIFLVHAAECGNDFVLKVANTECGCDQTHFDLCKKEYDFYKLNESLKLPYVPEIVYSENHKDFGIILVMKRYTPIAHEQWNIDLQKQAIDLCARFNSLPVDEFAKAGIVWKPVEISSETAEASCKLWSEVLSEHEGRFDCELLEIISKKLDSVCAVLNSEPHHVCHGDFHQENLLLDDTGKLYLCDYQAVTIGKGVSDLAFFISRGLGFGIPLNDDQLLSYYCECLSKYSGTAVKITTLKQERAASTLLNTFLFWAYFLKGTSYESVAVHYEEMKAALELF